MQCHLAIYYEPKKFIDLRAGYVCIYIYIYIGKLLGTPGVP